MSLLVCEETPERESQLETLERGVSQRPMPHLQFYRSVYGRLYFI